MDTAAFRTTALALAACLPLFSGVEASEILPRNSLGLFATNRDGTVYVARGVGSWPDSVEFLLSKLDKTNDAPLWTRRIPGGVPKSMAFDDQGNAYVGGWPSSLSASGFPATLSLAPGEFQAGFVVKVDSSGNIVYAVTTGRIPSLIVAVDRTGAAYIVGSTYSADLPVTPQAMSRSLNGRQDAFVAKLSPRGERIEYATYVGTPCEDSADRAALDAEGNLVVLVRSGCAGEGDPAYSLVKLTSTGSAAYSVTLPVRGGPGPVRVPGLFTPLRVNSLAVSSSGNVWIAGDTDSPAFLVSADAQQSKLAGYSLLLSRDLGESFQPTRDALAVQHVFGFAGDAARPSRTYAATSHGVFRSDDDGETWTASGGLPEGRIIAIAVAVGETIYAVHEQRGVFQSADAGKSWRPVLAGSFRSVAVAPQDPAVVYVGGPGLFRSSDGGASWTAGVRNASIHSITVDPNDSSTVLLAAAPGSARGGVIGGLLRSADGGRSVTGPYAHYAHTVHFDVQVPGRAWAASSLGLLRSDDRGRTWSSVGPQADTVASAEHPSDPAVIYAMQSSGQLQVSRDGGDSFTQSQDSPWMPYAIALHVSGNSVIHAGGYIGTDSFLMRLNRDGKLVYSTLTGGRFNDGLVSLLVDSEDRLWACGVTNSHELGTNTQLFGPRGAGDAMLLRFSAAGHVLSSYVFGGSALDSAQTVMTGPEGSVLVIGGTSSWDYPLTGPPPSDMPPTPRPFRVRVRE